MSCLTLLVLKTTYNCILVRTTLSILAKKTDVIFPFNYMQQPFSLQTKKLKINHLIKVEHMKLQHDLFPSPEHILDQSSTSFLWIYFDILCLICLRTRRWIHIAAIASDTYFMFVYVSCHVNKGTIVESSRVHVTEVVTIIFFYKM